MLQMASVYGLQQTAKHAPVFFLPRADEVRGAVFSCLRLLLGLLLRHGVASRPPVRRAIVTTQRYVPSDDDRAFQRNSLGATWRPSRFSCGGRSSERFLKVVVEFASTFLTFGRT